MTLEQIKVGVDIGEKVYWSNLGYAVKKDKTGEYIIAHDGGHIIGLVWGDGVTMNGKEADFFTWNEREELTEKLVSHEIADIMRMGAEGDFEYLSNVLSGGVKPYSHMTIHELNREWEKLLTFDIDEGRV